MLRPTTLAFLVSLAAVAPTLAGCSGTVTTDPAPVAAASQAETASLGSLATSRAPLTTALHGPAKRIADALAQVDLRADQRKVLESLAADAEGRHALGRGARQALADALATEIAEGAIDRAALAPKIQAVVLAMKANQHLDRAAFERVHALLDGDQRAQLVEALVAQHHHDHADHAPGEGMKEHDPAKHWGDILSLSDDQRSSIHEIVHASFAAFRGPEGEGKHGDFHAMHERGRAILDAFKGDTFAFDDVAPPTDIGEHVTQATGHAMDVIEKVLPLLGADQRLLAAHEIREHLSELPGPPL